MIKLSKVKTAVLALILIASFAGCKAEVKEQQMKDREGNDISVTENVEKIISLAPSTTQILVDLGLEDKLVAVDKYSKKLFGENSDLPAFDIMNPDAEQLANLEADIIFATGMSKAAGDDPLKLLKDMGACVAYIPTSRSIAEIKEDIYFIAEVTNTKDNGQMLVGAMEKTISEYAEIGKTIADRKTVYFEIYDLYSFGKDVFLDEIIGLVGAVNILENETGWISVAPEIVVAASPDCILTSTSPESVSEIKSRAGFSETNAVKNGSVYYIDTNLANYANHNIVGAMREIAKAVYPEEYKDK